MKVDGIWCLEITGVYGWERVGTVFLENGRYFGGSADHHSVGRYDKKKDRFEAYTRVTQHGDVRAVYGSKLRSFDAVLEGTIDKKRGQINGRSRLARGKAADIAVRLTRLADLE